MLTGSYFDATKWTQCLAAAAKEGSASFPSPACAPRCSPSAGTDDFLPPPANLFRKLNQQKTNPTGMSREPSAGSDLQPSSSEARKMPMHKEEWEERSRTICSGGYHLNQNSLPAEPQPKI